MKPNILFIVLDSFPANKCYGNNKSSKTPNLDFLINNGTYFSQAFSSADGTAISLGSMFTGVYPFKTGMRGEYYQKLDLKVTNYFQIFKKNGYHTFAIVPKITNLFGLTEEFENNLMIYSALSRLHKGLGKQIIKQLESLQTHQPWICYLHLLDSHIPVDLPNEFDNSDFGITLYDRMISAIDAWIGQILKKINLDKTLVVLTADHGEFIPAIQHNNKIISFENVSLNNFLDSIAKNWPTFLNSIRSKFVNIEQEFRKKRKSQNLKNFKLSSYQKRTLLYTRADPDPYLYDDIIHIPLILAGYGITFHKIISDQVRSIDIFPTISELVGLQSPPNIDGRSLVPLIKNDKLEELPIYIESAGLVKKSTNDVIGIRTTTHKYFRTIHDPTKKVTLYDLKNDPHEEKNIAILQPELVRKMETILTQIRDTSHIEQKENLTKEQTDEIENELRKLGYLK